MIDLTDLPYDVIKANLGRMHETADKSEKIVPSPKVCDATKEFTPHRGEPKHKNQAKTWRRMNRIWNGRTDVERICFPCGAVLHSDGSFRGPIRLAVHLQRLVAAVNP